MPADVVVRFAPSPTGYLHIGGARTAIFNWLFARQNKGRFILRIEDTDTERSTQGSVQGILDSLKWLGLEWDQGPDFQSRFVAEHRAAAERMLASGHAYKCFCSPETLKAKRERARTNKTTMQYDGTCRKLKASDIAHHEGTGTPYAVRLKVPRESGTLQFEDAVYGKIEKAYADIEDAVIVRSNGQPLYLLSNAVDDIRDGVTHVIRGQDGLANTPKQILIYQALGATVPVFAHMSLALDPQKAKISKRRHGEMVAVHFYRERGFLPWALVNFLVLMGWSTSGSQQFFSPNELIDNFSLDGISKANCIFDIRQNDPKFFTDPKAISINAHYLRTLPMDQLLPVFRDVMIHNDLWQPAFDASQHQWLKDTLDLIRARFQFTTDVVSLGQAYFTDDFEYDTKAAQKHLASQPQLLATLPLIADRLAAVADFSIQTAEACLRDIIKKTEIKPAVLMNGLRTAVTGHAVGPDFMKMIMAIGQARVCQRLRKTASKYC